jgi:tRNA delta(2)-isopentenylpyrophosphate transferase
VGQKKFFTKLKKIDPIYVSQIKPTDIQRSIRGYEVKFYTKKSLIEWFNETKPIFDKNSFMKLYINYPRKELIERISKRSEQMVKEGVVKEVKKFLTIKVKEDINSNKVIGVSEINDYLDKIIGLETLKERISIKTRQYAKRQSTWARGQMSNWQNLEPQDLKIFLKKI